MSPDKGRGTSGKGGGAGAAGPAATRRLGLLIFGVTFLVLFVVVAIAEGLGDPSIPSGDVALVENIPDGAGNISQEQFDHQLELAALQAGEKKAPKPGDAKYDEIMETALKNVLEATWIKGEAAERGIEVSEKEAAKELKKVKKESFKSEAEFQKFLKESGFTDADVNERVELQIASAEIQEELKEEAPKPTQSEIEDYYAAAKSTQFTQQPSRNVRLVVNKDRGKAEEAQEALSKDNSAKNWSKVAKKYSEEAATKENGGLQEGLQEGTKEEPLDAAIFSTPEGQLEGPIKDKSGYTVFEVVNTTPESVQELKSVESQIKSTLAQQAEQEYFQTFVAEFTSVWTSRTFCADGFVTEQCSNYKSSGHPTTAPPGCYEANPKEGLPEACPAPVAQLIPALPGSVTPLERKGKPLAQRPRPMAEAEEEGAGALEGLPEGVPPPAEEAPPVEEAPPAEGE